MAPACYTYDMELDHQRCYRAVLSRDGRFDGRFFTAVTTTGIYCRPICPARPPKFDNVRFYACAAAAQDAGFRPCRRCRPETSPGTPAWLGTSATVSRALRLIASGALDSGDVDELASRLGVGSRHLRRLFDEHLGASPIAIAQTRRTHFASRLIEETDLPMTEISLASGFSSLRRFNTSIRETFARSPSEIRGRRGARGPRGEGGLLLRLPYRPPYDWEAILGFLGARAIPGVEEVEDGIYRRSIATGRVVNVIEVRRTPGKPQLTLRLILPDTRRLARIVEGVRRTFDLGADPFAIAAHLRRDPRLAASVREHPGLRVPGAWDPFELAVRAILGQQVTVKGARTLATRLVERFGRPLPGAVSPGITHLFPSAADLADARVERIGMPAARAEAIRSLAQAVRAGRVSLETGGDDGAAVGALTRLPGVGDWTAAYVAMRAMGEPDVFPSGDIVLRRTLSDGARALSTAEAETIAERWRPWRSYAVLHIWMQAASRKEKHAAERRRA
jgi:AraC family transcriptional regulator of adaptative response / DNA-3-methyladenine glycosylase II